jgi:hypothetical protein
MPHTITVRVTQEDIDEGVRHNCDRCPVALATSRGISQREGRPHAEVVEYVEVAEGCAYIIPSESPCAYVIQCELSTVPLHMRRTKLRCTDVPRIAADFIQDFDSGQPVTPLTFDLTFEEV